MSNASDFPRELMLKLSANDATRLFRNNVGMAWAGKAKVFPDRSVLINEARPLHAGLCEGSSDLIGWHTIEITPAMVGRRVALFVAMEAKTGVGRLTKEQRAFLAAVERSGGVALEARSVEQAQAFLLSNPWGR